MKKRRPQAVVLSGLHLGSRGCPSRELLHYLKSIRPETVVVNGDSIDRESSGTGFWPGSHRKVIRHLLGWAGKGVQIWYLPGSHNDPLRRLAGFRFGNIRIASKVALELPGGRSAWCFPGSVFDVSMQRAPWLARLGAAGYGCLLAAGRFVNRSFLSGRVIDRFKSAVSCSNFFGPAAAATGIEHGFDFVQEGPAGDSGGRTWTLGNGRISRLHPGNWCASLTALEFEDGEWRIHRFCEADDPGRTAASDRKAPAFVRREA
ncbi:UDP-2,3-diacylglucosamine diphosphatase [Flaviaesturariibacter amylovorans]